MKLAEIKNAVLLWGPVFDKDLEAVAKRGHIFLVPENRPFMLGLKHNCPRLRREGLSFVYCPDNALGILFARDKIYKTLIFAKERKEKGVVGVCGSLYAALLSKLHNVSIEVFTGDMDGVDLSSDACSLGGKTFVLAEDAKRYAERPVDELIDEEYLK